MSRRHDLERHRRGLTDIRGIMNSMKTLAYMETRKLERFLDAQQAVVMSIEEAASDFLGFYPRLLTPLAGGTPVYLLIGTERGFCGDINHRIRAQLETLPGEHRTTDPLLIAVGRKLETLLTGDPRLLTAIDGASVAEDVPDLLSRVVDELTTLQSRHGDLKMSCLYQGSDGEIVSKGLLPPFQALTADSPPFAQPPLLNLSPEYFLAELAEHYLFAALHEILYAALAAENHERVTHLESAVQRVDEETDNLDRQINGLRQEEITEEIEVLLLNASNLA